MNLLAEIGKPFIPSWSGRAQEMLAPFAADDRACSSSRLS